MKAERLGKIAEAMNGILEIPEAENVYARGVSIDTRTISPGEIFFALTCMRDGHDFVLDAYEKGTLAAVVERKIDLPLPQIIVKDTLFALGELAQRYRNAMNAKILAITGSVGKTTVREMITCVLEPGFRIHSAKKNYNNLIGLPLTLLEIEEEHEIAVVELGINQPGEMERLSEIASPDMAVITAIAEVHTEGLGSISGIIEEKAKIITAMSADAPLFINTDSVKQDLLNRIGHRRIITYGIDTEADYSAKNMQFLNGHPSFSVCNVDLTLKHFGKPSIYAALAAIAIADYFDIPMVRVVENLQESSPKQHRMVQIIAGELTILDDSYNSSPTALYESLRALSMLPVKRRIAVLGDMLELGELDEKYHREVGQWVAEMELDGALFFGRLMQHAVNQAVKSGFTGFSYATEDFNDAIIFLKQNLESGDAILIKGSHSMDMIQFVEELEKCFAKEKQ